MCVCFFYLSFGCDIWVIYVCFVVCVCVLCDIVLFFCVRVVFVVFMSFLMHVMLCFCVRCQVCSCAFFFTLVLCLCLCFMLFCMFEWSLLCFYLFLCNLLFLGHNDEIVSFWACVIFFGLLLFVFHDVFGFFLVYEWSLLCFLLFFVVFVFPCLCKDTQCVVFCLVFLVSAIAVQKFEKWSEKPERGVKVRLGGARLHNFGPKI